MVVGYGITSKMRLPTVSSLIEKARIQARSNGRSAIVATDIQDAMMKDQIPSDQAMQYAFPDPNLKLKGKSVSAASAPLPQRRCTEAAAPLQASFTASRRGPRAQSTISADPHEPALISDSH